MQSSIRTGEQQTRLFNPLLDLAILGLETQLKAWQTYQVEGTRFVANRMRANLEYLRALGHCCDTRSMGECHRKWLGDIQKDYAEEWGRITATHFAVGFGDLASFGWLFGQRAPKQSPQLQADAGPQQAATVRSRPGLATAA